MGAQRRPRLAFEDVAGDLVGLAARDHEVRNSRLVGCHPLFTSGPTDLAAKNRRGGAGKVPCQ